MKYVFGLITWLMLPQVALAIVVYSNDFDAPSALGSGVSGSLSFTTASGQGVLDGQGFKGLGNAGQTFGGNLLRQSMQNSVVLSLSNLPTHDLLDIGFLFASIDTWDGTDVFPGFPSPDIFRVTVDGTTVFDESFRNVLPANDPFCDLGEICQSYVPPTNGQIITGTSATDPFGNVGFSSQGDGAYDMYLESAFQDIAHTASSLTIVFDVRGGGRQGLADESWAIDNLQVSVAKVPEPSIIALLTAGLMGFGFSRGRKRSA